MSGPSASTAAERPALTFLTPKAAWALVAYNLVLAAVLGALLVYLITAAARPPGQIAGAPSTAAPAASTSVPDSVSADPPISLAEALLQTLLTMLVAGAAGGTLCNLRGIFRWMAANDGRFPAMYATPFVVRPFTGALTGLFVFFVGNLLVSALAEARPDSWRQLEGRLPYVGLALLAGFATQEFMERLKEVARTTFGDTRPQDPDTRNHGA